MKITVLGAGLVGGAIVKDLAQDYQVTAVDLSQAALEEFKSEGSIQTIQADLKDPVQINQAIKDADLVVSAVPGSFDLRHLKGSSKRRKMWWISHSLVKTPLP